MNISVKKFISIYGAKFFIFYVLAFFLLVTFFGRFEVKTFPGDFVIPLGENAIYLPFTSSLGVALFFLVVIEIYRNLH